MLDLRKVTKKTALPVRHSQVKVMTPLPSSHQCDSVYIYIATMPPLLFYSACSTIGQITGIEECRKSTQTEIWDFPLL